MLILAYTRRDIDDFIRTVCEDWCRQIIVLVCAIMCL